MIGYIIFIIIFLVGILYIVKNKDKKNELMVSLYIMSPLSRHK